METISITEWAKRNRSFKSKNNPFIMPVIDEITNGDIDRVIIKTAQPQFSELRMFNLMDRLGVPFEEEQS